MTGRIEDEKLMAYVDGALPPDERSEIRALLLEDPSLQVRVDALREGAELVRSALDGVLSEPLPEDLLTRIEMAGPSGEKASRRVLGPPPARWVIPVRLVEIAAAACFLLVAGGYIGHWIGSGDGQRTALDPRIAAVLTSTTSGTVAPLETDGTSEDVMPLLTFADRDGRYCRQYLHRVSGTGGGQAFDGVACRDGSGTWTPMITVRLESAVVNGESYRAASGSEQTLVDSFIETRIDGAPITGTGEADLIRSRWPARNED